MDVETYTSVNAEIIFIKFTDYTNLENRTTSWFII